MQVGGLGKSKGVLLHTSISTGVVTQQVISYSLFCFLKNHSPSMEGFFDYSACLVFFVCWFDCSPACVFAGLLVRLFVWLRVRLVGCLPVCGFVAEVLASSVLRCFVSLFLRLMTDDLHHSSLMMISGFMFWSAGRTAEEERINRY